MSSLQAIQEEVGEWSAENFGTEQPASYPLGGAGEEMGELMHSVLKRLQGIREDDDDVGTAAEIDAVGDIGVYLLDYLYREGIELEIDGTIREAANDGVGTYNGNIMEVLGGLFQEYGVLWQSQEMDANDQRKLLSVVTIFVVLDIFCMRRDGIDSFNECIQVAWFGEVRDREWDADVEV